MPTEQKAPRLNRGILQELARTRLEDARVLLENERFAGAYYVAGYAVECALKACIAKQVREHDFPDKNVANKSWVHDLDTLIGAAGLRPDHEEKLKSDRTFARYWKMVAKWRAESRYDPEPQTSAKDFLRAIADPDHGVLPWLQEYW